ncbi:MAG: hypothetical protein U5K38_10565 [Woeseiaceae bacterium]|nr:hypothetical protein [Woeseiaceae bacterium]
MSATSTISSASGPGVQRSTIAAIALSLCALLAACSGPRGTPEDALRAWVERAGQAAGDKDRGALVGMISPSYADARGNDRNAIDRMIRVYFLRQRDIALLTTINDITVRGETAAVVDVTAGMAGTNSGTFGFRADAYRFELELEAHDGDWLLIGARWGELGGDLR